MSFEMFFRRTSIPLALTNRRGEIIRINAAFRRLLTCSEENTRGKNLSEVLSHCEDTGHRSKFEAREPMVIYENDRKRALRISTLPSLSCHEGEDCLVVMIQSFDHRKSLEKGEIFGGYDPLTGLPNPALWVDRLRHGIDAAARDNRGLALLLINLRRFKAVNSSFGHEEGDRILQQVAGRISCAVRKSDTVARHHGEKFAVLLEHVASPEAVHIALRKILRTMEEPFHVQGQELFLSATLGAALFPMDGENAITLLQHAEIAMRQASSEGSNCYHFFTAEMDVRARKRLRLESALHRALDRGEFVLFYQPIFDPATRRMIAVEALLRWEHPQQGRLPPQEFIPLLEETGLIHTTGDWVLLEACRQVARWRQEKFPDLRLAVNLSARQLEKKSFLSRLSDILKISKLPPYALDLEITESMLMLNSLENAVTLADISALGVQISIDDFGTGYSSLAYLKQFPVHQIKIDRSFTHGLPDSAHDISIIRAICSLAQNLGLKVTAEGIETREQLEWISEYSCQGVQGFFLAPPMDSRAFSRWKGF